MRRYDLALSDVADMTAASLDTVRSWLKPGTVKSHRAMPVHRLRLLEFQLNSRHRGER